MSNAPRGFTLVELLVALVLIEIGLLALVGSSATVVRLAAEGRARTRAARLAMDRLETIGARPCAVETGTAATRAGLREQWVVELLANDVREIRDSVTFPAARGERAVVLRTRTSC